MTLAKVRMSRQSYQSRLSFNLKVLQKCGILGDLTSLEIEKASMLEYFYDFILGENKHCINFDLVFQL